MMRTEVRAGDSLRTDILRGQLSLALWAATQRPQLSVRVSEENTLLLGALAIA